MSNISTYLSKILSAVYGREVRQSIHDAIEQCYDDVNSPDLNTKAFKTAIQEKIDDGSFTAMTIADGSITQEKLSPDIHFGVQDGEVTVEKLSGTTCEYQGGLNQINYDDVTDGYWYDEKGTLLKKEGYSISNVMPIAHNKHWYGKVGSWVTAYIVFFDSSDAVRSAVKIGPNNNGVYGEIPVDSSYARCCFPTGDTTSSIIFADEAIASVTLNVLLAKMMNRYINDPWGKLTTKELQTYFADESVPLSSLQGAGAKMYNLFDPSDIYAEQNNKKYYLLPLRKTYYVYNMSDEKITNGNFMMYVLKKNRESKNIGNAFIDVGTYRTDKVTDDIYEDAVLVYAVVDGTNMTENQINGLVISERNDLKEYHSHAEMYYEPNGEMKKMIQSAQENIIKQYDGGVMMTLGDSYTSYMKTFYDSFAEKHGLVQDNRGVASSTIAGDTGGTIGFKPFWNRLDTAISEYEAGLTINNVKYSADDVKLIVFMGGANDWSTVSDTVDRLGKGAFETDKGKLYGALNYIFATLLSTFKNADIVVILQPVNYNSTVPTTEENAKNVGFESLVQAQGMTDAQFSTYAMTRKEKIVREMAQMYGLTICDCCFEWYNPNNPVDAETYWNADKLHLSRAGHEAVVEKLEDVVNNLPVRRN